jgi:MFS family permease
LVVADAASHAPLCRRKGHAGTIARAEQHHGPAMDDPQSIQLSSLLFGTTITLANVPAADPRRAFGTYDEIAWVVTLNLVATAIATPTTGWLGSRLGWRGVMFSAVGEMVGPRPRQLSRQLDNRGFSLMRPPLPCGPLFPLRRRPVLWRRIRRALQARAGGALRVVAQLMKGRAPDPLPLIASPAATFSI